MMRTPQLLVSNEQRVAQDAGQWYLISTEDGFDQLLDVLDEAIINGIAQQGGFAMVTTPVQNNFDMAFTVEVWDAEPFSDLDGWQEAFEVHLDVSHYGLHYSWTNGDVTDLGVPPGSYRALVTARGLLVGGWPGSTTPGDVWRIRLWPDDGPVVARRIREFVEAAPTIPPAEFAAAGIAAVRRLQRMLDDRMPLSGRRGTATAERIMPGTRRKLYPPFHHPRGWLTQSSMGDDTNYTISGGWVDDSNPAVDANRIVPTGGHIRGKIKAAKSPEYAEATWSWEVAASRRQDGQYNVVTSWKPLIPPPEMTLRFELSNGPATDDWPTTVVTVIHDHVPAEFVEDLTAYWLWKLEDADYRFDLGGQRKKKARALQTSSTRIPDGL